MDFGQALELVVSGRMIAREGWNGKGLFVFRQVPSIISVEIVPKMQSLPDAVKVELGSRGYESISYSNQLALVDEHNHITGWSPSTSDALADDWFEYGI